MVGLKQGAGLAVLVGLVVYKLAGQLWKTEPKVVASEVIMTEYDYIIVGGGSAGCVLAARLSEDAAVSVLLLEAGGEETNNPAMDMPLQALSLLTTDAAFKDYTTSNPNICHGMADNKCFLPRGRALGGGSSVNCMQYVRGNREDYDGWAEMGCEGWSYKDVLPYFVKAENVQIPELVTSPYRGTEGPLYVEKGGRTAFTKAFVDAGVELGYEERDYNGETQEGSHEGQYSTYKGERWSTAKAYLRPAMHRQNLHVATHAFATKVLLKKKRAVGVEFIKSDVKQSVRAKREVILSAGAIGSPKILMLSGIGPKKHLADLNIPLIEDLPVGENHQDHVLSDSISGLLDPGSSLAGSALTSVLELLKYLTLGTGIFTIPCGVEGEIFVRAPSQPKEKNSPYIQFMGVPLFFGTKPEAAPLLLKMFNHKEEVFKSLYLGEETADKDAFSIFPVMLRPHSRGRVTLASADPFDPPLIATNYYDDPRDLDIMIDAIRIGQKLVRTSAFKKIGYKPLERVHPGCKQHQYDSDDYWRCFARHNSLTVYHSSGTCKMGSNDDPSAVLDPQLRVRGIKGLRVVDAAIMPMITSGNTNAPTIMIAEKAADLIRGNVTVKPINI